MQRIESCVVHARKNNKYYVKIMRSSECGGCRACGFGRKNYVILPALSNVDCKVGDRVSVRMPTESVKASYVYLYLIPLLFTFIGLVIPYGLGEKFMLLGAVIGLAVGFFVLYAAERLFRRKKEYMPVILGKITSVEGDSND